MPNSDMKRLILLLLCLYPLLGQATEFPCVFLNMKIQNNTHSTCHLIELKLVSGTIQAINDLPLVIPKGQISDKFVVSEGEWGPLDLILTYECGENKIVKFESQKNLCRHNATVDGTALFSYNLDAQFDASNGLYWDNKPAFITWTLTDIS